MSIQFKFVLILSINQNYKEKRVMDCFRRLVFTNEKVGISVIATLALLYSFSILILTIAFFTPYWLHGVTYYSGLFDINGFINGRYTSLFPRYIVETCETAGLISGHCRFPYARDYLPDESDGVLYIWIVYPPDLDRTRTLANDMNRTFYVAVLTLAILYATLVMTLVAYIFKLFENRIYMSFLSLTFGSLYPIGAISILAATIYLEIEYKSEVGYSTVLGTVSGGLMLLFYAGLRFYNDLYIKHLIQIEKEVENNAKTSWKRGKFANGSANKYE